jgi:hypothetical protein
LGGWGWEDCGSRAAQANSSREPISKITRAKWAEGVAQVVKSPEFKSPSHPKNRGDKYDQSTLYVWMDGWMDGWVGDGKVMVKPQRFNIHQLKKIRNTLFWALIWFVQSETSVGDKSHCEVLRVET